jgi:menaquinone-dependent protoporphyrinogen oxidase
MRILVAYGTKRGGTRGLAEMIAQDITNAGLEADIREARRVKSLAGYDAAIIGGSAYMFRWHRDVVRLVKKHATELRSIPTWLFCSGPVGAGAENLDEYEKLAPKHMLAAATDLNARGTKVFGGRLEPNARGFIAAKMAKNSAGDWRDPQLVDKWVHDVVASLGVSHS